MRRTLIALVFFPDELRAAQSAVLEAQEIGKDWEISVTCLP